MAKDTITLPAFDLLCRYAPLFNDSLLIDKLREAQLFQFPGRAHEVLPKEFTEEEERLLMDTFFLPFPVVAIEDTASCVVLWDTRPDQQGLVDSKRMFIEAMPVHVMAEEYANGATDEDKMASDALRMMPKETVLISAGTLDTMRPSLPEDGADWTPGKVWVQGFVTVIAMVGPSGFVQPPLILDPDNEKHLEMAKIGLRHARTAVEEVMYFNTPSRFVVERRPVSVPKRQYGKVKPSDMRSTYTLLTPIEIRKVLRIGGSSGESSGDRTQSPHVRRRHFRVLRADRYVHKKGQTITIPATWVGPEKAQVSGHIYRVRLDL